MLADRAGAGTGANVEQRASVLKKLAQKNIQQPSKLEMIKAIAKAREVAVARMAAAKAQAPKLSTKKPAIPVTRARAAAAAEEPAKKRKASFMGLVDRVQAHMMRAKSQKPKK